jgi:hypothetical protein
MASDEITGGLDDLLAALQQVVGGHLEAASLLKDVHIMQHSLFQHEVMRLERKLGSDHPRTQQMQARLEANLDLIREIETTSEVARIRVPPVEERGALIHGRVVDENGLGLAGLVVFLEDRSRQPIPSLRQPTTDASGYYALSIDSATMERLDKVQAKVVGLAIRTQTGEIVRPEPVPLKLAAGESTFSEIALNREDLSFRESNRWPAGGSGPESEDNKAEETATP